jgi:hypothetical protein
MAFQVDQPAVKVNGGEFEFAAIKQLLKFKK